MATDFYGFNRILTEGHVTVDMWLVLAVLVGAIVLFVTELIRVDVVAVGVLVVLMATGILTAGEAVAGFGSTLVLAIASLFVVGGAVLKTGLAAAIGNRILLIAGEDETRLTIVIMLAVALLSGFMSDTGTVAVLFPAIISLAAAAKLSPSRLLIPLSYGALLGGAMTLIGTPPNILVSELLIEEGETAFSFFSYTPVGLALLVAGVIFMVTVGRRLLPQHELQIDEDAQPTSPTDLWEAHRLGDSLYHMLVPSTCDLCDQTIGFARLRSDFGVNVISVAVPTGRGRVATAEYPSAETKLEPGAQLVVQGEKEDIEKAARYWGMALVDSGFVAKDETVANEKYGLAEVLVPPRSRLLGRSVLESRFGDTYNVSVLDISRPGVERKLDPAKEEIRMGDTLLLQGNWLDILQLRENPRDVVLISQPPDLQPAFGRKAIIAAVIMLAMLVILVSGEGSLVLASMGAALAMVLTGCLTMDDAYQSIDWKSIVLIAGMLPMSTALGKVGLVQLAADGLIGSLGSYGPIVIMAGLFLLTSLFTQVISNTATTVIVAPVALATARALGVQPQAFLMAVAIAASMAFASPVASPVNTLVMGAGQYTFRDYMRVGVPLVFIMLIVTLLGVPLVFPFN